MPPDAPPQNLEAEDSVLGAMMLTPSAIAAVADVLQPSDFYRASNGKIFAAALDLDAAGEPVDSITLSDYMDERGLLSEVGGQQRITELARIVPASANARHYAQIVRETALLRGFIRAGGEISRLGWERPGEIPDLVQRAEETLYAVTTSSETRQPEQVRGPLRESYRQLKALHDAGDDVTGVSSGFPEFDRLTTGLQPGNLVILAARPGMGKTALAMNIATNAALGSVPTCVFSLEMSEEELMQRLIASEAKVESNRLRTGNLDANDWAKITPACARLADAPLFIDDTSTTTVAAIRSKARRLKLKRPDLGLVVIDYLQLIQGADGDKPENRVQTVAQISRQLKTFAGDLAIPVVALAQLNRKVEDRGDKRPNLADLRDSGALEQDADLVVFLYRDDYYDENASPGTAEVILAKQRNGPTGTVKLSFLRRFSKFLNQAQP